LEVTAVMALAETGMAETAVAIDERHFAHMVVTGAKRPSSDTRSANALPVRYHLL
jgi:hypothetical protein